MSWADTLNILINLGKGSRERGMQTQALTQQSIENQRDRNAQGANTRANMWFTGLSNLGSQLGEGIWKGREMAQDWNKMESQQKATSIESQLDRDQQTAINSANIKAREAEYTYKGYDDQLGTYKNPSTGEEIPWKFHWNDSDSPGDHQANLERLAFARSMLESQIKRDYDKWLIDYENVNYPKGSGTAKDNLYDIDGLVRDRINLGQIAGTEFFYGDGSPRLDKFNNDYDKWATALQSNSGIEENVRKQIRNIIRDNVPADKQSEYLERINDYVLSVYRQYTPEEKTSQTNDEKTKALSLVTSLSTQAKNLLSTAKRGGDTAAQPTLDWITKTVDSFLNTAASGDWTYTEKSTAKLYMDELTNIVNRYNVNQAFQYKKPEQPPAGTIVPARPGERMPSPNDPFLKGILKAMGQ